MGVHSTIEACAAKIGTSQSTRSCSMSVPSLGVPETCQLTVELGDTLSYSLRGPSGFTVLSWDGGDDGGGKDHDDDGKTHGERVQLDLSMCLRWELGLAETGCDAQLMVPGERVDVKPLKSQKSLNSKSKATNLFTTAVRATPLPHVLESRCSPFRHAA